MLITAAYIGNAPSEGYEAQQSALSDPQWLPYTPP